MGSSSVSKVNNVRFANYNELTAHLRSCGVESLQAAIFIDFSKSNQWTGEKTYGRGLHDTSLAATPYEQVLQTLAPVLHDFDDDDVYPVYRFGCAETRDRTVLPLLAPQQPDEHFRTMPAVCAAYRAAAARVALSGPTTFAPAIDRAVEIATAYAAGGRPQHVLCIIVTDGDVSDFERDRAAVCRASAHPVSICAIGVGDGPFRDMQRFDNLRSGRKFDNFHFCDFTRFAREHARDENPALAFATEVFAEVGLQERAMRRLGLL